MRYYSVCYFITPDSGAFNLVQLRIEFANMLLANIQPKCGSLYHIILDAQVNLILHAMTL